MKEYSSSTTDKILKDDLKQLIKNLIDTKQIEIIDILKNNI